MKIYFSPALLTLTALFLLSGCANKSPPDFTSWANPNSWFGDKSTVAQNDKKSQTPKPAPAAPKQASSLPPSQPLPADSLSTVSAAKPVKVKVAILLPLTGKNAALGQAMLNAAQQAVFDVATNNFEL